MRTFAKVKDTDPRYRKPLEYGWMLKLSSVADVVDYFEYTPVYVRAFE